MQNFYKGSEECFVYGLEEDNISQQEEQNWSGNQLQLSTNPFHSSYYWTLISLSNFSELCIFYRKKHTERGYKSYLHGFVRVYNDVPKSSVMPQVFKCNITIKIIIIARFFPLPRSCPSIHTLVYSTPQDSSSHFHVLYSLCVFKYIKSVISKNKEPS